MRWAAFVVLAVALLFSTVPASAQADPDFHWYSVNAGAGWTWPERSEAGNLNRGWNFEGGAGFALPEGRNRRYHWSAYIDLNFMFDRLKANSSALQQTLNLNPTNPGLVQASSARANYYDLTLDPTIRLPVGDLVSVYLFAGGGWLKRSIQFMAPSNEGSLLQPASPTVFGSGGNSGVVEGGGGVNFKVPHLAGWMLYGEVRVVHGLAINNATTLVPISLGVRW